MSLLRLGGPSSRLSCFASRKSANALLRPTLCQLRGQFQTRAQHNQPSKTPSNEFLRQRQNRQSQNRQRQDLTEDAVEAPRSPAKDGEYSQSPESVDEVLQQLPKVKVRYLRPAIWALLVSSGIYVSLAYLEAKDELKKSTTAGGWLQAPQWNTPKRTPPGPIEVATGFWETLNPISRLSYGIIGVNSVIHLSSFVMPAFHQSLWHMPARNVNYTQFTSMFVHGGALHLFVNMYCVNNFLLPVGYSRVFEGSPYHTLSFFLSTGVLSGFAQHWSTLIPLKKHVVPEIFIRCGGASGALLGVLGVFCMQYPTAGLGIMFVPVHFDAQYVLAALVAFDFIGMVRGYSFVNFGHAAHLGGTLIGVAYSQFNGKERIWKPLVRYWKRQLQHQA